MMEVARGKDATRETRGRGEHDWAANTQCMKYCVPDPGGIQADLEEQAADARADGRYPDKPYDTMFKDSVYHPDQHPGVCTLDPDQDSILIKHHLHVVIGKKHDSVRVFFFISLSSRSHRHTIPMPNRLRARITRP